MQLNNTIILPGDNLELSKKLLTSLIQKEDVVTVIIFGRDSKAEDAVQKADIRANGVVSGITRKVAWMQDVGMLSYLQSLLKAGTDFKPEDISIGKHLGVGVSMTDVVKDIIPITPAPDFIRMEIAFMSSSTI